MDYLQIELFQEPLINDETVFQNINHASDGGQLFAFPMAEITSCKITAQSFVRQDYQKFI